MAQLIAAKDAQAQSRVVRSHNGQENPAEFARILSEGWQELCARYLPVSSEGSVWKLNRKHLPCDPAQGWKIHISSTILSANSVLEKVAPFLSGLGILFKAPRSLQELGNINCGLFYGYSQVGKFITVYTRTHEELVFLAPRLYHLTRKFSGPVVPYDQHYRNDGNIYYRYGAFSVQELTREDGTCVSAIMGPDGNLIPDLRQPGAAVPGWTTDPFKRQHERRRKKSIASPLKTTYRAYEALSQRGKGGVYRALDLGVRPARLCVLKEGRRAGEISWDGRDGYWRVEHESKALFALSEAGINVAASYATFTAGGHFYLVTEFIEGDNLQSLLWGGKKRLPIRKALEYGIQVAKLLDNIHSAGWVWRDCKPLNLIVSKEGILRPLDFEGACPVEQPDKTHWGTNGYVPPEWLSEPVSGSRAPEDLFALGATLHQMLTGRTPDKTPAPAIGRLRRNVPKRVTEIVSALLDANPQSRPEARVVSESLASVVSDMRG